MPLRRIHSERPLRSGATVTLDGDAANHVLRVLRLRTGDELVVFDGTGFDFEARIGGVRRDEVLLDVGAARPVESESPLDVTLLQGICRGPRMDTVVQKATELGVARIVPVLAERGVVRLDDDERAGRKQSHWLRVAVAAAEQSGRSRIPTVDEATPLAAALRGVAAHPTRWMLDPAGEPASRLPRPAGPVALLIGPEGGLTAAERGDAEAAGFARVRLGPRILRTETAPLAALAILQFLAGDLG